MTASFPGCLCQRDNLALMTMTIERKPFRQKPQIIFAAFVFSGRGGQERIFAG
jgi:hypothetical protein